jgi:hypothetical protein
MNSQYLPKKGHDKYFSVPVLDRLVSISAGLVPEPALCPGTGAADRSQETLYLCKKIVSGPLRAVLFSRSPLGGRADPTEVFTCLYSKLYQR